ncbi:hypothetical protein F5Y04DRAFT_277415 [Hypomontagnella monticulosa]|nr:hypothetical protein F5Y04DRAFT_277415 [Hypomontagnella monticulosa]
MSMGNRSSRHASSRRPVVIERDESPAPRFQAGYNPQHQPEQCQCDSCVRARLAQRIAPRPSNGRSNNTTRTTSRASSSTTTRQQETFEETYVYPTSAGQIHFPVVDYTSAERVKDRENWPKCTMAVTPSCAKMSDIQAALAPRGSGHIVVARIHRTKKTEPIANYRTPKDLFKASIQLEIWDENVPTVLALNRR